MTYYEFLLIVSRRYPDFEPGDMSKRQMIEKIALMLFTDNCNNTQKIVVECRRQLRSYRDNGRSCFDGEI